MNFELVKGNPYPVLREYIGSRGRISIIRGPLGSGKTYASCERIFTQMCEQEPNRQNVRKSRWVAIRNTYPDLLSTTVKDWRELFDDLGRYKGGGLEPPTHYLKFRLADKTVVEAELVFIALDRPSMVKKLRGMQVTGFWLNELKELDKSIVDMADLRHGRYPSRVDGAGPTWHGMIGDTNSPDDDHWLFEMESEPPEDWEFFIQPGGLLREMAPDEHDPEKLVWTGEWLPNENAENLSNLPPDYYIKGQQGKSQEWIAVNLGNEFGTVHDGKPIYREQWNDILHVSKTVVPEFDSPFIVGLDFGLTPSAIIGQETQRGAVNILDELTSDGMGIQQFTETLLLPLLRANYRWGREDAPEFVFIGDPAGNKRADTNEQTVFKELEDLGIEAEPANTNDPLVRWEAVRYFLQQLRDGKPAFQLHRKCSILRKGFNGGYKLRRIQKPGSMVYHSIADKNKYSHPHDALQYMCLYIKGDLGDDSGDFERPAEDRWAI